MDTHPEISEESTTPDLVELGRRFVEAGNRRDIDAVMSHFAPDPVWESMGMATSFEGVAAIRGFYEDFYGAYEEYRVEPEEILDLGNGVTFSVIVQQGRVVGSTAHVRMRFGAVTTWADGLIKRNTSYTDVDEARAAAERLAEEPG
jgi:ketosteroid isomerase-like protein